nr:orf7 protein - Autographa californica nuclear polyhedrosis virus [Autographa californica nucleopolyhedrovirus]
MSLTNKGTDMHLIVSPANVPRLVSNLIAGNASIARSAFYALRIQCNPSYRPTCHVILLGMSDMQVCLIKGLVHYIKKHEQKTDQYSIHIAIT